MARSGWVAVLITALLIAGLGSPPAFDRAAEVEGQLRPLLAALTSFPAWSTDAYGGGSDLVGPLVAKVVVVLVVAFIGAGTTGRVGSAVASFLASWGAVMIGAALAGGVFAAAADAFAFDGTLADGAGGPLPLVVEGIDEGVQFGLYTGWLVGFVMALMARRVEPDDIDMPLMPGSAPGYPTINPSSRQLSGPLTQPVPAVPAVSSGRPVGSTTTGAQPATRGPRPGRPMWPEWPEWPDTPDTPATRQPRDQRSARDTGAQGAYSPTREGERPNWTRWSDR